jgi:hypothetical protein
MISDDDLDRLMRALEAEAEAFLSGRFGVETGFTQAEAMTIFGPFGGPSSRMPMSELLPLQKVASSQFESGTTTFEVVKRITSGDLAVLVLIERSEVRIAGSSTVQPWVLRTTQVFRLDGEEGWLRLHRHADPLIRYRPSEETFALARAPGS